MELDLTLYRNKQQISHAQARFPKSAKIIGLFGISGAGKSTLLNAIAGVHKSASGQFKWNGFESEVGRVSNHLSMMLQSPVMFPGFTVHRQLELVANQNNDSLCCLPEVIAGLSLEPLLLKLVDTLSGGEVQRVALARLLLTQARILLLDEPVSALDEFSKQQVLQFLQRLTVRNDARILIVSHNLSELAGYCNGLMKMENGVIASFGTVESVLQQHFQQHPDTLRFSVISGEVVAEKSTDELTCLQVNGVPIYCKAILSSNQSGSAVLYANNVVVDRSALPHTSLINALTGVVHEVQESEKNVHIAIRAKNLLLHCQTNPLVQSRLKIKAGETITARFDSV